MNGIFTEGGEQAKISDADLKGVTRGHATFLRVMVKSILEENPTKRGSEAELLGENIQK